MVCLIKHWYLSDLCACVCCLFTLPLHWWCSDTLNPLCNYSNKAIPNSIASLKCLWSITLFPLDFIQMVHTGWRLVTQRHVLIPWTRKQIDLTICILARILFDECFNLREGEKKRTDSPSLFRNFNSLEHSMFIFKHSEKNRNKIHSLNNFRFDCISAGNFAWKAINEYQMNAIRLFYVKMSESIVMKNIKLIFKWKKNAVERREKLYHIFNVELNRYKYFDAQKSWHVKNHCVTQFHSLMCSFFLWFPLNIWCTLKMHILSVSHHWILPHF